MILHLLVVLLLCFIPEKASAQGCGATNPNCIVPTAPNGATDNRAASTAFVQNQFYVINVMNFGAKCDNSTDDSSAINSALAAAKAIGFGQSATQPVKIQFPPNKKCLILNTLNFTGNPGNNTGFLYPGIVVENAYILCATNGTPCIDASGSSAIQWKTITIVGNNTSTPNIGIQLARLTPTGQAAGHTFNGLTMAGFFTFAAVYNLASEVTKFTGHPSITNANVAGCSYAVVLDGLNHFNATSAFQTINIVPDTTTISFNDNWVDSGAIVNFSSCAAAWVGGTGAFQFNGSSNLSASSCGITLWQGTNDSFNQNTSITFHAHFETVNVQNTFCIDGPAVSPIIRGFIYDNENGFQAANAIFKITGSATSVTVYGLNISVSLVTSTNPNPKLFDDATKWNVSGHIRLPIEFTWTEPASFSGELCLNLVCTVSEPTIAINRNPDFIIDQPLEGGSTTSAAIKTITDGWVSLLAGGDVANKITYQRQSDVPAGSASGFSFRGTQTGAPIAIAVGSRQTLNSVIEGSDWRPYNFGSASAQSFNFDFCAKANNSGQYSWAFGNTASNRLYVLPYSLTANVRQCFHNTIPGDTAGAWGSTPGSIGLYIWNVFAAGTNFNTASPNTWVGSFVLRTASAFDFLNTAGAFLEHDSIYIYSGPFRQPHKLRQINSEMQLAQRFYQKSYNAGVVPGTNPATAGAVTLYAPYASAAGAVGQSVDFAVPMVIANPTMTFFSTNAASANCYNSTAAGDIGAASAINIGSSGFFGSCAVGGGFVQGAQIQFQWTADSKL